MDRAGYRAAGGGPDGQCEHAGFPRALHSNGRLHDPWRLRRPTGEGKLTNWAGTFGGVVRARVRLTGKTTEVDDHGVSAVYSELELIDPSVVAGHDPHVEAGWVAGGNHPDGTPQPTRGPEGALWGPDGAAVLVIDPAHQLSGSPEKVSLHLTPVVGDNVVFTGAGCWGFSELHTTPFSGNLSEVPGSETAEAMRETMTAGPYFDFVSLATKVLGTR